MLISLTTDSISFEPSSVAITVELVVHWMLFVREEIFVIACFDSSASFLISPATTAKPLPCSPALAASTAALSASMFVCSAISSTTLIVLPICCECSESSRISSAIICIFCLRTSILSALEEIDSCSFCEKLIDWLTCFSAFFVVV